MIVKKIDKKITKILQQDYFKTLFIIIRSIQLQYSI